MLLELRDHIVVCCFGDEETPTVGLVNFLMPLRASNIRRHELVPIVLLGDEQLLEREWHHVSHFPLVYTHVVRTRVIYEYSLEIPAPCLFVSHVTLIHEICLF